MLVVDSLVCDSIISVTTETPLSIAIDQMVTTLAKVCSVERRTEELSEINIPITSLYNHIFIVEQSRLLGIFSNTDIPKLIHDEVNMKITPIREFMYSPPDELKPDFELETAFDLMQLNNVSVLPIIAESGEFLGAVTIEIIAQQLAKKLQKIQVKLDEESSKRRFLEKVQSQNEELTKANKQLQRVICDRIATEAQLLQTTSELQEIFHAFPDTYFRIANDGTILSYHAREYSDLYLPPKQFLNQKVQDVLPTDIAIQFQSAICELNTGQSHITIEYQLSIAKGQQWFEARLLTSIQNQIIVIVRNITERKISQNLLQESYQDLESRVEIRTQELKSTNERLLQEIVERQRIEESLRYRAEFEKIISTLSTHFINLTPDCIDQGIEHALATISNFVQIDRSYVFLFSENSYCLEAEFQWCAEDIGLLPSKHQDLTNKVVAFIINKFQQTEVIHISTISELTIEESFYKQILIAENIQSQIILPIISTGQQIGYLGFDAIRTTKSWSEESITLLKMVAEMFGHAFARKRVEQVLSISKERYKRAISAGKVGIWEWNIETNEIYIDPNLKAMLGYTESEMSNDFNEWLSYIHPDDIIAYKVEANAYLEGLISKYEIEHRMRNREGNYIWFLARGTVLRDEDGKPRFMAGSNTDITISKQAELKLKASLQEKEVLLKEIHHRVKNNLQVISSLLRLQAGYIKDESSLEIFRDSQNRVRAMAMIHENLYHSHDLASINFAEYTHNLMQNLTRCYGINKNIQIHQNVDGVLLRIDTAIPCGLIINELASNAIKHAFVNQEDGQIYIDFLDLGKGKYSLSVSDNGVGFTETIEEKSAKSLGLQLVWSLVEQLEGSIVSNTKSGTSFTITFIEAH